MLIGDGLIEEYRRRGGEHTLLGFSRGKDSIATALALRGKLSVWPIYFYIVPNLSFVEEGLAYYSKTLFDGRRIIQFPEGAVFKWLNSGVFQTPGAFEVVKAANFNTFNIQAWWRQVTAWTVDDLHLPESTMVAVGIRARDSPMRWLNVNKFGPIRTSVKNWLPIWDYTKADVLTAIRTSGVSLPIDYLLFGRSLGGGLDARFMVPIKRRFPEDWKRILEFYPLADLEVWKHERFVENDRRQGA